MPGVGYPSTGFLPSLALPNSFNPFISGHFRSLFTLFCTSVRSIFCQFNSFRTLAQNNRRGVTSLALPYHRLLVTALWFIPSYFAKGHWFPLHPCVTMPSWPLRFATSSATFFPTVSLSLPRTCPTSAPSPSASGFGTALAAKFLRKTVSPISSNTWSSKAPNAVPPKPSPAKWIPSAACWTPSPPKSKSVSTPKFSTTIYPSPSTSSAISAYVRASIPPTSKTNSRSSSKKSRWTLTIPNIFSMKPLRAVSGRNILSAVPFSARRKLLKSFHRRFSTIASANGLRPIICSSPLRATSPTSESPNSSKSSSVISSPAAVSTNTSLRRPARPSSSTANPISSRFISASAFLLSPSPTTAASSSPFSTIFSAAACPRASSKISGKSAASLTPSSAKSLPTPTQACSLSTPAPQKKPSARLWISPSRNFAPSRNRPSPRKNFSAPKITSRARSCSLSSPPVPACPIWRARNSISAASSPSTKFLPPSKPSLARTSNPSPRTSSAPNKFPPPSSAPSTASPSTAPASPAEIFHGRSFFPSLTLPTRSAMILKSVSSLFGGNRSAFAFPFWRPAAPAISPCWRRSAPDSSWTPDSANAKRSPASPPSKNPSNISTES